MIAIPLMIFKYFIWSAQFAVLGSLGVRGVIGMRQSKSQTEHYYVLLQGGTEGTTRHREMIITGYLGLLSNNVNIHQAEREGGMIKKTFHNGVHNGVHYVTPQTRQTLRQ